MGHSARIAVTGEVSGDGLGPEVIKVGPGDDSAWRVLA